MIALIITISVLAGAAFRYARKKQDDVLEVENADRIAKQKEYLRAEADRRERNTAVDESEQRMAKIRLRALKGWPYPPKQDDDQPTDTTEN